MLSLFSVDELTQKTRQEGVLPFLRRTMLAEEAPLPAYIIATVVTALSCLTAAILSNYEDTVYFSLFFPAILVSAALGGAGPAIPTLIATFVWSWVLLTGEFLFAREVGEREAVSLAIFLVNAGVVAVTGLILRRGAQFLFKQSLRLAQSEERLNRAQRAASVGLWDWNVKTGEVVWSDQFYVNWGLDRAVKPSYEAFLAAIHPEDRERVKAVAERVLKNGEPYMAEYRVPQSDGTVRWMAGKGVLERDKDGAPARMIGVNLDITDRKTAEAEAQSRELRLSRFAETDVIGILFGHVDGSIQAANNEFLRIVGYTREDFDNGLLDWRKLTPAEWLPLDEDMIKIAQQRGFSPRYEKEYVRKDGSRVPILIGYSLVDGASVAVVLDLSERKAMEEALAISEERFRSFAEQSKDVVWVLDAVTGRHEYLNPAYETIWLDSRAALFADRNRWLSFVHEDDRERVKQIFSETKNGVPAEADYRIVRPDGSIRWINDTGFPIRGPDGAIKRIAGLARDVTDRKRLEEQQSLLLAELNHRVKNTLATVQSLMVQSGRRASDYESFKARFQARLMALAKTHNVLMQESWSGASLKDVVRAELAPYIEAKSISLPETDAYLSPSIALSVGLIVHELATNAAKYGALSKQEGRLSVTWRLLGKEKPWLRFCWRETNGPPVVKPSRKGFGSVLIERAVKEEHGGDGEIRFDPEGVTCYFTLPLQN
jgi:PAS domain S-box-containing protein